MTFKTAYGPYAILGLHQDNGIWPQFYCSFGPKGVEASHLVPQIPRPSDVVLRWSTEIPGCIEALSEGLPATSFGVLPFLMIKSWVVQMTGFSAHLPKYNHLPQIHS